MITIHAVQYFGDAVVSSIAADSGLQQSIDVLRTQDAVCVMIVLHRPADERAQTEARIAHGGPQFLTDPLFEFVGLLAEVDPVVE